ncbi:MAG: histidine kinase [Paucimonas sp.]|jgi:putative nucleotidyltransferase with HDIG domain|nr:histidine kinase [Paucimonas sp.]
MSTLHLTKLIKAVQDLPSPPAVVMELLNRIDDEDADIQELAAKVSHDQALTAKTLRLANSPYFATQIKVTTLQQAITLLGFRNVRNIITTAALSGCFPNRHCAGFDWKLYWRHSLAAAFAAGRLAHHKGLHADYAYTAGLLHDIGRLAMVTAVPDDYERTIAYARENECSLLEAEREVLQMDHAQAGELLASHWNFSDSIRLAIAAHHEPDMQGAGFLAAIVHVANALAEQLATPEGGQPVPAVSQTAWLALDLNNTMYEQIAEATRTEFEKTVALEFA